LETLPWHEALWTRMRASREAGRIAHAMLLAGPRGVGKRMFANRLASWLLCETGGADPCSRCRSCRLLQAGSHPDFFRLQPEEDKRDISIDAVRELSERLALTSNHRGLRVAVIEPADSLNLNGVNALLKTIEEPPAGSHLLLISERPMMLAATLRSRCQILRFGVPPFEQALAWLRGRKPEAAETLLAQAHGAPLRALELIDSGAHEQRAEWARRLAAVATGHESPLALAAGIDKPSAQAFLEWLLAWALDLQKTRLGVWTKSEEAQPFRNFSAQALDRLLQDSLQALRQMHGSAPAQLTIESVMIDLWQLSRALGQETGT
jgi:DNA polymerase-3 subunit delta'